jgi:hypothetical protein
VVEIAVPECFQETVLLFEGTAVELHKRWESNEFHWLMPLQDRLNPAPKILYFGRRR